MLSERNWTQDVFTGKGLKIPTGDIFQHVSTSLHLKQQAGGLAGIWWVEARNAAKLPTKHSTLPSRKLSDPKCQ